MDGDSLDRGMSVTRLLRKKSANETDTPAARDARIALYRERAEQRRDIFTGQRHGTTVENDD